MAAAIEAAYTPPPRTHRDRIAINATVPAVAAGQVPEVLARFPGARTAKVKVAEPGQTLADDVARVNAVRAQVHGPRRRQRRLDRRRGRRGARALTARAAGVPRQPCATVPELAELRRLVDVPIAADESIRKAEDPLHVVRSGAADVAVLKVAPLGGVATMLDIARQIEFPWWCPARWTRRSASAGSAGRRRPTRARHACGLGTGGLFVEDVAEPLTPVDGDLPVATVTPDPARLAALAAPPERRQWWIDRIGACYASGRTDLVAE